MQTPSTHFSIQNDLGFVNDTNSIDLDALIVNDHQERSNLKPNLLSNMLSAAVVLCDILGCLCIILNMFIIFTIIKHRKRILRNVFYVIVFHCAIVDLLRGCCLIIWGIPHILISNQTSIHDRLLILKINQFIIAVLRSCNLLTIFNLLVFTCNEFLVIRYPLLYRRHFRRRVVFMCLFFSWLISLIFGNGSVFSNFFESSHSIVVGRYASDSIRNNTLYNNSTNDHGITRRTKVLSFKMLSMLMISFLCYLSLLVVLVCYGSVVCTIRRFRSENSTVLRGPPPSTLSKRIVVNRKQAMNENGSLQIPNNTIQNKSSIKNSNKSGRHWQNHLMSRHKYLIVIGTVLFVDMLFLFPYSGIQLVAFLHLSNIPITPFRSALIKWSLQILIGMHAVCQPLCYFRMTEFRRLACPRQKTKSRALNSNNFTTQIVTKLEKSLTERRNTIVAIKMERSSAVALASSDNGTRHRNRSAQSDITYHRSLKITSFPRIKRNILCHSSC